MATLSILHQFARPNERAMATIKAELDVLPTADGEHFAISADHQFVGSINDILLFVREILERDYDETKRDSEQDGYEFEYVLSRDGCKNCEVAILTRLFSSTKPPSGSIYYDIAVIRRIGADRYMVTMEDEDHE